MEVPFLRTGTRRFKLFCRNRVDVAEYSDGTGSGGASAYECAFARTLYVQYRIDGLFWLKSLGLPLGRSGGYILVTVVLYFTYTYNDPSASLNCKMI